MRKHFLLAADAHFVMRVTIDQGSSADNWRGIHVGTAALESGCEYHTMVQRPLNSIGHGQAETKGGRERRVMKKVKRVWESHTAEELRLKVTKCRPAEVQVQVPCASQPHRARDQHPPHHLGAACRI
ncbi:hypothetical protein NX059_012207 [Plenodomus lindquistii]|nr:hypothetical protein NX059_012207 [Plenodomus lindquistii]